MDEFIIFVSDQKSVKYVHYTTKDWTPGRDG